MWRPWLSSHLADHGSEFLGEIIIAGEFLELSASQVQYQAIRFLMFSWLCRIHCIFGILFLTESWQHARDFLLFLVCKLAMMIQQILDIETF